jgi:LAS superfamily LD-carboxypeptidase LdcB
MITLANAAAITRQKLSTLRPEFEKRAHAWFDKCVQSGIVPYVYEGYRSPTRQNELYAIGRSKPGTKVTNAMAWQSFHNYGLAFDWVPLRRTDKAEGMYESDWTNEKLYEIGNLVGEEFHFRRLSWESPHLEDATFKDWHELREKFTGVV